MNLIDVLARARDLGVGVVRESEIETAREVLRSKEGDISSAISIIGLCGGENDHVLLEDYMVNGLRNVYGEAALRSLCRYMGLTKKYRSFIRDNIFGDEEFFYNARMSSIQQCDLYFKGFSDDELGCKLISIVIDKNDPDRVSSASILVKILNISDKVYFDIFDNIDEYSEDCRFLVKSASEYFSCANIVGAK